MIIKSSCRGSKGLGEHLAAEENEVARVTETAGIVSLDTESGVAELVGVGAGSRTKTPLVHASISPEQLLTEEQWRRAWDEWERARALSGQAYIEVEHQKKGRSHRHRVYSRVDLDRQAVIKQSHEKRINERVARSLEIELGHDVVPGAHSRAVLKWAEQHDRTDLAAGVAEAAAEARPRAERFHREWQQEERTGINLTAVAEAAFDAWQRSDSLASLNATLGEHGLALAAGRKTVQLVDQAGECHDLRRTLAKRDRAIRATDVKSRAPMDQLAPVHEVSKAQRAGGRALAAAPARPGPSGQPGDETQGTFSTADPDAADEIPVPGRGDGVLGRQVESDDEAVEIRSRLSEIDDVLDQVPAPPDREQVREDAIAHAQREAHIPRKSGGYTTLDDLDARASEKRSQATNARECAEDTPRWRFIEWIRASRRATAAEHRADRAKAVAKRARAYVEARPHLWRPQVDEALARYDERVERQQKLERERDELAERLGQIESDGSNPGVEPDTEPEPEPEPDPYSDSDYDEDHSPRGGPGP